MERLPFIKNRYFVLVVAALMLVIGYELAFKNTLNSWYTHRLLSQQLAQADDISSEPVYLDRKNKNLDAIIATYHIDSVAFKNNVITTITRLAENEQVKFTNLPADDPLYHTPQFIIQKLNLEGDFFPLMKLVNQLPDIKSIGMLRSVSWKAKKTSDSEKSKKINLEIYLEIYR